MAAATSWCTPSHHAQNAAMLSVSGTAFFLNQRIAGKFKALTVISIHLNRVPIPSWATPTGGGTPLRKLHRALVAGATGLMTFAAMVAVPSTSAHGQAVLTLPGETEQ